MIEVLIAKLLPMRLAIEVAVLVALLVALGVQTKRVEWKEAQVGECKQTAVNDRNNATAALLKVQTEYRAEEQRRRDEQKEIADEADRKIEQARADAAVADAAAGRLQQRVAALVAAAREAARNPIATQGSAPATDAIGLLAELQRRADEAAGIYARIADERGVAGEACERAYLSLGQ